MPFKRRTWVLAIGSAYYLAPSAWADTATNVLEIAPITVTGEKINRTLKQTQSSVVVVTEEKLREHGDKDLVDVFARTPRRLQPGRQ